MAKEQPGWTAKHRFARIAPRKVRLVIGLIRGQPCADALEQPGHINLAVGRIVVVVVQEHDGECEPGIDVLDLQDDFDFAAFAGGKIQLVGSVSRVP